MFLKLNKNLNMCTRLTYITPTFKTEVLRLAGYVQPFKHLLNKVMSYIVLAYSY